MYSLYVPKVTLRLSSVTSKATEPGGARRNPRWPARISGATDGTRRNPPQSPVCQPRANRVPAGWRRRALLAAYMWWQLAALWLGLEQAGYAAAWRLR
jgi:hypothetical protein